MLERIEQIQGVGLLHDANGKPYKLHKAALLYAENGRGKSTLASILRSAATGNGTLIQGRATVDGTHQPNVLLQFGSGHKVSFSAGVWSELRSDLLVFDSDFIENNVHSGGSVSTDHRKNLLEFALGEDAVAARKDVDKATLAVQVASNQVKALTSQLSGHHQGVTIGAFEKLAFISDADEQIEELQKRIVAANSIEAIAGKPVPTPVPEPTLNIDALFTLLGTSLDDVQEDAETIVRSHVVALGSASAESWLSQGQGFDGGVTCPYCAQGTVGNEIIRAYRTHFNAAYAELKKKVAQIEQGIAVRTGAAVVETFAQGTSKANIAAAGWDDLVKIDSALFDRETAASILLELQSLLKGLAAQKQASPADPVGSEQDRFLAENLWLSFLQLTRVANGQIMAASATIEAFRAKLATENVQKLHAQIENLQMAKRRHTPEVFAILTELALVKTKTGDEEKRKKDARDKLDALMKATLRQYERSINALLKKFGASFSIEKMDANFRGSAPRSEYGLLLRGKSIPLEGGPPSFATALSEGDKRTLAFAFFVASTLGDLNISQRVVVIDDPMCSLDINRKQQTKTVVKDIYTKAKQIIVLAHDAYFIRDLYYALSQRDPSQVSVFQLQYTHGGYSDFAKIDINVECESAYYKHHRLLMDFVSGKCCDHGPVAKAIRPLLEGYLHRRFPGLVPKDQMFGQVVSFIRDAKAPHPVTFAQNLIDELQELNDYAGQFHHDTNPGNADTVQIVPAELRAFSERALNIVHRGNVPNCN